MSFKLHRMFLAAVGLVAFLGLAAPVSSQTTFTACRVPAVGAIYMIGLAGLPTECLDPSHVEFSWTEGGSVADGGVTTAKLADGAVTTAKLSSEAVTGSTIATGAVTRDAMAADAVDSLVVADGSLRGSDIKPGTVTSLEIFDRTIQTDDVGVGALTPLNFAEGAVGAIVYETLPTAWDLPTTPTDLGSISFSAPAQGMVLLIATGSALIGGEDTRVRFGIGSSAGSTDLHEVSIGYTEGTDLSNFYSPFTVMAAAPISDGGLSRYYVTGWRDPDATYTGMNITNLRVALIYVPNGY